MKNRRIGKIKFHKDSYNESIIDIFYGLKFLPHDIEYSYYCDCIVLTGYSSNFRELNSGDIIPEYNVIVNSNNTLVSNNIRVEEIT